MHFPLLNNIWQKLEPELADPVSELQLLAAGYTEQYHTTLIGLACGEVEYRPGMIETILNPVKQHCETQLEVGRRKISDIADRHTASTGKIATLFKHKTNPNVQALHVQKDLDTRLEAEQMGKRRELLNLVQTVLSDPRLGQRDPTYQAHSMEY